MNSPIEDDNVLPIPVHGTDRHDPDEVVILDELDPNEFAQRVTNSPEEMREFITDTAVNNVVRAARPWGNRTLQECLDLGRAAAERENASKVVQLSAAGDQRHQQTIVRRWLPFGAAAAIAAMVLLLLLLPGTPSEESAGTSRHYSAPTSVPRTETLSDGTRVKLAPATTLDEEFTARQRNVRLPSGEAEFTVAHDQSRPFLVHTPFDGVVQAVGTVFKVSISDKQVNVRIDEGTVKVSRAGSSDTAPLLVAGQTAILRISGDIEVAGADADVTPSNPPRTRRTPISFTRERLARVALIFNERSGRRAFDVRGAACEFLITSVLDPSRPEELVRDINDEAALEVLEEGEVNVIRAKGDKSEAPCRDEGH
jgi:transmembrane sensor